MLIWPRATASNWLKLVNFSLAAMLRMLQRPVFFFFFPPWIQVIVMESIVCLCPGTDRWASECLVSTERGQI